MSRASGGFDFDGWNLIKEISPSSAGFLFVLAVVGFGTKAGFMPLHIWLPEAHPAAPSPVSAVMSGVMIKTGIYGLVRFVTFFDSPPAWWGWLLIAIGASSGILGVLFALAQHDLKRLLAYHSVENIGIISLGLGLGLLGLSLHLPVLIILGFSGGLLHVVNHAVFKGLLFLGAGSVLHGAKTLDIEHLGGLYKRMPWTGLTFLVGSLAICGLPPLNGFISEFVIYWGAARGLLILHGPSTAFPIVVIVSLVLIGGLAAACFTKAFGMTFLGEPRSVQATQAHESGWAMRLPMIVLAGACVAIGLMSSRAFLAVRPVLEVVSHLPVPVIQATLAAPMEILQFIVVGFLIFLVLTALLWAVRCRLLVGRTVQTTGTWDCGYHAPSPRMQYTASSFAQPLTTLFQLILRTKKKNFPPVGFFPKQAAFSSVTPDVVTEYFVQPVTHGLRQGISKLRWIQQGRVNIYIFYIGLTLLILLFWSLR